MSLLDEEMYPINIGTWCDYSEFTDKEQIRDQCSNFIYLPLSNGKSDLCFIYTKQMSIMNNALLNKVENIRIENVEVTLEDEIYYTAKIEGSKTTRIRTSEIHNGAKIQKDSYSECMTAGAFNAVKLLSLFSKLTCDNLVKVWNTLVEGCCENEEVRDCTENQSNSGFRIGEVFIGTWVPPCSSQVPYLMQKWIKFYNSEELDSFPFIKAAILHFSFETIHPFCDGNGRLGRLLMNNYLISRGIEACRAVSFSMSIDKWRSLYDAAFYNAENLYGDCTPFIEFILRCMNSAFDTALEAQNINHNTVNKCSAFK